VSIPNGIAAPASDQLGSPAGSKTFSVTRAGIRSASHTVTELGVTLHSTGPAKTRGFEPSVPFKDAQDTTGTRSWRRRSCEKHGGDDMEALFPGRDMEALFPGPGG
jgi:hypothetical protein